MKLSSCHCVIQHRVFNLISIFIMCNHSVRDNNCLFLSCLLPLKCRCISHANMDVEQNWWNINKCMRLLSRRIAHCHWWPMMDSHGSLCLSMSIKRNIFHGQICPWTSKRSMNIDDSTWTNMKIHALYHEIPWTSMYFREFSWPISTGCVNAFYIKMIL